MKTLTVQQLQNTEFKSVIECEDIEKNESLILSWGYVKLQSESCVISYPYVANYDVNNEEFTCVEIDLEFESNNILINNEILDESKDEGFYEFVESLIYDVKWEDDAEAKVLTFALEL
jgi:hypothetical protein